MVFKEIGFLETDISLRFTCILSSCEISKEVISEEIGEEMKSIFKDVLEKNGSQLIECGYEDDHIHLLIKTTPTKPIAELVRLLKGRSSYEVRKKYRNHLTSRRLYRCLWSPSYCVLSCGGAPLNVIKQYVESQGEH